MHDMIAALGPDQKRGKNEQVVNVEEAIVTQLSNTHSGGVPKPFEKRLISSFTKLPP